MKAKPRGGTFIVPVNRKDSNEPVRIPDSFEEQVGFVLKYLKFTGWSVCFIGLYVSILWDTKEKPRKVNRIVRNVLKRLFEKGLIREVKNDHQLIVPADNS